MFKKWLILLSLGLILGACSTQRRESLPQLTDEELGQLMSEFGTISTSSAADIMAPTADVVVFHARDSINRPIETVLPLYDMGFLNPIMGSEVLPAGLNMMDAGFMNADVLFVDSISEAGDRAFALLVKLVDYDGTTVNFYSNVSEPNDYEFTDTKFTTYLNGNGVEAVILTTQDLSEDFEDELGDSIKLKVELMVGGQVYDAGGISTLHGYQFN